MYPILAGDIPFFSFYNTNFVVLVAFLLFVGFLVFKGVPGIVLGLIDKRADNIRNELAEAQRLREEAEEIFAEYERKLRGVKDEAEQIVVDAKRQAEKSAEDAEARLAANIERRVEAGKAQIASAEAAVMGDIRARAAGLAVEATRQLLAKKLAGKEGDALIGDAIKEIETGLN